jgi:hypothetical protein
MSYYYDEEDEYGDDDYPQKTVSVYMSPNAVFLSKESSHRVIPRPEYINIVQDETGAYVVPADTERGAMVILTPNETIIPDATAKQRAPNAQLVMRVSDFVRLHERGDDVQDRQGVWHRTTIGPAAELPSLAAPPAAPARVRPTTGTAAALASRPKSIAAAAVASARTVIELKDALKSLVDGKDVVIQSVEEPDITFDLLKSTSHRDEFNLDLTPEALDWLIRDVDASRYWRWVDDTEEDYLDDVEEFGEDYAPDPHTRLSHREVQDFVRRLPDWGRRDGLRFRVTNAGSSAAAAPVAVIPAVPAAAAGARARRPADWPAGVAWYPRRAAAAPVPAVPALPAVARASARRAVRPLPGLPEIPEAPELVTYRRGGRHYGGGSRHHHSHH